MSAGGDFTGLFGLSVVFNAVLVLCLGTAGATTDRKATMNLTSSAFAEGQPVPAKYTCDGQNVSPPIRWSGVPQETKSLVLIMDDPDAPSGTWVHWVVYDLPPTATELPEDLAKNQYIPGGAKQGLNDFKHLGYGGPCPPAGKAHRYYLKLYAVDRVLNLRPGSAKKEVERAMEKHMLGQAQLMGTYERK